MNKKILSLMMGVLFASQSLYANSLDNMQLKFVGDESVLKLDFSDNIKKPEILTSEPNLIHLKFEGVDYKLQDEYYQINEDGIRNIKIEKKANNLHLYISLSESKVFDLNNFEKNAVLTFRNDLISYDDIDSIEKIKHETLIDDIKFKKEQDNQSKISISHNSDQIEYESLDFEGGVEISFKNIVLPSKLFRNNDLSNIDNPIKSYFTKVENGEAVLKIYFNEDYKTEIITTEMNNNFVIVAKGNKRDVKITKNTSNVAKNEVFDGELISFDFQDVPIKNALYLIAAKMNLNLVMGDNVDGKLTLLLNDVPHDQALDVILRTKGLGKYVEGNIMIVAPLEEIVQREEFELTSLKKIKEIKPLISNTIQINYAKSSSVFELLEGVRSERGSIIFDERTNKMFIEDTSEKVEEMVKLVNEIDIPVRQVSVEARIVYAKKTAAQTMGVQWGAGNSGTYNTIGDSSIGLLEGGTLGSLGAAGNTADFTLGFLNANIDATLNALEQSGDVEIVAKPLIIAANKQKSKISSGQEYPYYELSDDGTVSTEFKDIVLSLEVTPQITPDDHLILDLDIEQDSISEITDAGPALDTTNITTQVIVQNNETLVLGGVFQEDTIEEEDKVPVLGDIPFLGNAFKYKETTKEKVELLIFITPKILDGEELIRR